MYDFIQICNYLSHLILFPTFYIIYSYIIFVDISDKDDILQLIRQTLHKLIIQWYETESESMNLFFSSLIRFVAEALNEHIYINNLSK